MLFSNRRHHSKGTRSGARRRWITPLRRRCRLCVFRPLLRLHDSPRRHERSRFRRRGIRRKGRRRGKYIFLSSVWRKCVFVECYARMKNEDVMSSPFFFNKIFLPRRPQVFFYQAPESREAEGGKNKMGRKS